jgi:undecaprenyl pyrophosphate phosphatase UppP
VAVVLLVPCVVYISVTVSRYVFAGSLLKRESTIKQELINEREATRLVLKVSLAVLVAMVPVFVVAYALHDCLYACFGPYIAAVGSQVVIAVLGCVIAYFAIKHLSKSFTKHK